MFVRNKNRAQKKNEAQFFVYTVRLAILMGFDIFFGLSRRSDMAKQLRLKGVSCKRRDVVFIYPQLYPRIFLNILKFPSRFSEILQDSRLAHACVVSIHTKYTQYRRDTQTSAPNKLPANARKRAGFENRRFDK